MSAFTRKEKSQCSIRYVWEFKINIYVLLLSFVFFSVLSHKYTQGRLTFVLSDKQRNLYT
jgi:hypothetical protein